MKRTWLVLAVLLAGTGAPCRADDATETGQSAAEATQAIVRTDAKDAPKNDAGKDYVEPVNVTATAGEPACAKKSGFTCKAPERCYCGRGSDCCHRIWAWLTYRPLKKPCLADCCHKCTGCHVPPLYLYFLDQYHACASAPGCTTYDAYGCASGCASCTHR